MNGYEIAATIIIPALAMAASVFAVYFNYEKYARHFVTLMPAIQTMIRGAAEKGTLPESNAASPKTPIADAIKTAGNGSAHCTCYCSILAHPLSR